MQQMYIQNRWRAPQSDVDAWKKKVFRVERDKVRKLYPNAQKITHKVITHGQPDHQGDLAKTNSWAVRTTFEVAT